MGRCRIMRAGQWSNRRADERASGRKGMWLPAGRASWQVDEVDLSVDFWASGRSDRRASEWAAGETIS